MKIKANEKGKVNMCVAIAEMKKDSFIKGENRAMALMRKLLAAGRYDDAKKAAEDIDYKNKLMSEFALS